MKFFKQIKNKVMKGPKDSTEAVEKQQHDRRPQPWWKKTLLGCMVGASIIVVVSWAVFTIKPAWRASVQGLIASDQSPPTKKSRTQRPPQRVSKAAKIKTRKATKRPQRAPKIGTGQSAAARTERPPTTPPQSSPATPSPSTSPKARPQVSIPASPRGPEGVQGPSVTAPSPTFPFKKEESELDDYLEIGIIYAQKGAYKKAEDLFLRVTKENPSSAQARNNLGFVYLKQEKYEQAEREFKEAIRIDSAFVLPYYNLACLYSRKEMDVEALIYLKRALNRDARVKMWAATDEDFAGLRSDVVFQELVGIPPPPKTEAHKGEGTQGEKRVHKREQPQQAAPPGHSQPEGPATATPVETRPPTRIVSTSIGHAQEPPIAPQALDRERDYVVQEGDTLWEISYRFYGDPFLWPRLWQHNQYVPNPHLIYPGDRIRLYPYTVLIETKAGAKPPTAEEVKPPRLVEEAPLPLELVGGGR